MSRSIWLTVWSGNNLTFATLVLNALRHRFPFRRFRITSYGGHTTYNHDIEVENPQEYKACPKGVPEMHSMGMYADGYYHSILDGIEANKD